MNTYTPGPWVAKHGLHETKTFVWVPGGDLVASVVMENDAKLIAAAPELLEALHALTATVDAGHSADHRALQEHSVMRIARAAIAKARGES